MKILSNKTFKPFSLLTISFLLIELIFRLCMNIDIFNYSSIRVLVGILVAAIFFAIILSFCNKLINKITIITIVSIFTIYALMQAGFNNYLGTYMSFSTTSQAGAVADFIFDFLASFKLYYWLILLPLILLVLYYIFLDKKITSENNDKKFNNDVRILFILVLVMNVVMYHNSLTVRFMQNDMQLISNEKLFKNPVISNIAVNQFGLGVYAVLDIKSIFTNNTLEMVEYNRSNKQLEIDPEKARNIDDTKWKQVNEKETNETYKNLNSYFMSKSITPKNDYTGLLKDKNLIVIMIETGSNVLTDYPEYFPNMAKLYNEGWAWVNNFSPRNACSTGNNEMSGITSLYTISNRCTSNVYKDNTYFESIFNLFNNAGYTTAAYHDYTEKFYERKTYLPNMGSKKYYNVDDLGIVLKDEAQPWPSDVEFFNKAIPDFINEDKFMVWLTTVSPHMKYDVSSTTGDMYLDMFSDKSWSIDSKRYMSKLKIFDNAVGALLDSLEKSGKLSDTVIVLYSDHEPYGLDDDKFAEITKYSINNYLNIDRTPFIIYNPSLEAKKYDEYTSYVNILPTIANLFDLEYDPRLYGGNDLLSDTYENYVVFSDGSWRSDIAFYDANSANITYFGKKIYPYNEIKRINDNIKNEIIMNNLAIETDYFTYLNKKLN